MTNAALQLIDCSGSQVSDLSPLVGLEKLESLDASACTLARLPPELINASQLRRLVLRDTRIDGIPSEVLSQANYDNCLTRLRDHLRDLETGVEAVADVKLIVLGNGRVGKTQICRRIRGESYDPSVPSTHGITVSRTELPPQEDGETTWLNIWDFGGQDIYHGTHALFMRTRAVFLVVWHPDSESRGEHEHGGMTFRDYPLSYWLEYVKHLGGAGSPVVLVQSQSDRAEDEQPIVPVSEQFLQFVFCKTCCYSARKDRGRAALNEALEQAVEHLRAREGRPVIGSGRMAVRRRLEAWREEDSRRPAGQREHRTLSRTQFVDLCETVGSIASADSLLEYLHNAGVVFYRKDLFANQVVLDQSWALEAVYAVFHRQASYRQIRQTRGRFTRSFLGLTAWQDYSEREQELFLSMMVSCGICFEARPRNERIGLEAEYIAPDLLPGREDVDSELAGRWEPDAAIGEHVYDLPFLHHSLIRTVISTIGGLARESAVYWKYGVWIYEATTGARAIVEQSAQTASSGRIAVRTQGGRRDDLLRRIREMLEGLPSFRELLTDPSERLEPGRNRSRPGPEGLGDTDEARREPDLVFRDVPPERLPPKASPEIYVSYAWGDDSVAGRRREQIVDQLCSRVDERGLRIIRDKTDLKSGARISDFMRRMAGGDFVITVVSAKYLRSPYCMYELFHVFRHCGDDAGRFLGKIIPLILPDARIDATADRLMHIKHWKEQKELLEEQIREIGPDYVDEETYAEYKLIQEFAEKVGKMLIFMRDKLVPRDFERMIAEGFDEIFELLEPPGTRGPTS